VQEYPFALEYEPEIVQQIIQLPREVQRSLVERLGELAGDPRPAGYEKLEDAGFRVVWRSIRIVYRVDDANGIVHVVRVSSEPLTG
jgi:mRNA-degrading endonuclease RelE of RelBE toxin-antitoxin system